MKLLKTFLADILFILGNRLVIFSAYIMGYKDTVKQLEESQKYWLKTDAFKIKK